MRGIQTVWNPNRRLGSLATVRPFVTAGVPGVARKDMPSTGPQCSKNVWTVFKVWTLTYENGPHLLQGHNIWGAGLDWAPERGTAQGGRELRVARRGESLSPKHPSNPCLSRLESSLCGHEGRPCRRRVRQRIRDILITGRGAKGLRTSVRAKYAT